MQTLGVPLAMSCAGPMKIQVARLALAAVAVWGAVSCAPPKSTGMRSTPIAPSHSTVAASTTAGSPVEDVERKAEPHERRLVVLMDGRVHGVIPDGWVQLFDRSSSEIATFQIKNPADEGTPDSANVIVLVPPKWPTVQAAAEGIAAAIVQNPGSVVVSDLEGPQGKRVILARGQLGKTP